MECDGVAEEPDASDDDEDLDLCIKKKAFPAHATVQCQKAGPFFNGIIIHIMAVRCNGVKECANGIDEEDCGVPLLVSVICVLAGALVIVVIACVYVKFAKIDVKDKAFFDTIKVGETKQEAEQNLIIFQQGDASKRKEHSQRYLDLVMEENEQDEAESINQIKVSSQIEKTRLALEILPV